MGGNIIIFGHKFLAMAQKAYVIIQPGSLLHLSHGKIILSEFPCEFSLFCQKLQNIITYIFSSCYVPNKQIYEERKLILMNTEKRKFIRRS